MIIKNITNSNPRVALKIRAYLLSEIEVYALEFFKLQKNTSRYTLNHIINTIEQTPIYINKYNSDFVIRLEITKDCITSNAPCDDILDSDGWVFLPVDENEEIIIEFKIVFGKMTTHSKFCAINSIGYKIDGNITTFEIIHQRNHFNLDYYFEHAKKLFLQ